MKIIWLLAQENRWHEDTCKRLIFECLKALTIKFLCRCTKVISLLIFAELSTNISHNNVAAKVIKQKMKYGSSWTLIWPLKHFNHYLAFQVYMVVKAKSNNSYLQCNVMKTSSCKEQSWLEVGKGCDQLWNLQATKFNYVNFRAVTIYLKYFIKILPSFIFLNFALPMSFFVTV